jgi:hypothetical protein
VVYAQLLSSEQLGSLVAFMIALSLLGAVGYRPLFWLGAAAYGVAFALLLGLRGTVKPSRLDEAGRPVGIRAVGRALAPLIALTALTAGAEAGLSLLLILHLQSAFDLDPQEIALLFFPGAILLVVLPERAFEVAARLGVDPVRSLSRGGRAGRAVDGRGRVTRQPRSRDGPI